jgi:sRNA-binding regulator protein Hfq
MTGYTTPRGYTTASDKPTSPRPPAKDGKYVAKGHDAQLQHAMYNKSPVKLHLLGMGGIHSVSGVITRRDKFTITLSHMTGDCYGMEEIFYKHAISSVLIDKAAA